MDGTSLELVPACGHKPGESLEFGHSRCSFDARERCAATLAAGLAGSSAVADVGCANSGNRDAAGAFAFDRTSGPIR
jgi:hypothetical protein